MEINKKKNFSPKAKTTQNKGRPASPPKPVSSRFPIRSNQGAAPEEKAAFVRGQLKKYAKDKNRRLPRAP